MRVLIITQWFEPEPTLKGIVLARELQKRGHQVEVLTGFPNYPQGVVYPPYKIRWFQREIMDGIPVVRVPLYPSHDSSGFRRALNYLSFAISAAVLGTFLVKKPDVVYVQQGPACITLAAICVRLFRGAPIVHDIFDIWPDALSATGMVKNRLVLSLAGLWCQFSYAMAKHIVVISDGFKPLLVARGVLEKKIAIIYNWADEGQLAPEGTVSSCGEPTFKGRFNVVFAGNIGRAQSLDAILDAAALLGTSHPIIQFVFVGGGVDLQRLKARAEDECLANVVFLPHRPTIEIGALLIQADVLLVHLKDTPLFSITIPSKTQASLAIGRPILMAVRGEASNLVEKIGAGLTAIPEDPADIAAAAVRMFSMDRVQLEEMGYRGKEYYRKNLSLNAGCSRLEEIFLEC